MIYSEYEAEQDLTNLIEETFDTCDSNKDEIRWLISLLRGFMNIPNKRIEPVADNYKINLWQYQLQNYKNQSIHSDYLSLFLKFSGFLSYLKISHLSQNSTFFSATRTGGTGGES